ncbi:hypothetical protein pipiens_019822 [Culex pipiens pipiens]|uniref:Uncharacterized protein n=1 Tax=Culex pipiens pipiens TaxID=38569 RepID=A0ABD1DS59_CULPP
MTVDSSILAGTLTLSQENSIDSNRSSDREVSPDLVDHHTSSLAMIQHTTQKLQSLTHELNQSDEELENNIKNTKRIAAAAAAAAASPDSVSSSLFINGNSNSYNFQPIVPEQPTAAAAVPPAAPPSPSPTPPSRHHQQLVNEIDENTSRIVKIESYLEDVVDGRIGATTAPPRIAKPIPVADTGFGSADLMMESVDLSGNLDSIFKYIKHFLRRHI